MTQPPGPDHSLQDLRGSSIIVIPDDKRQDLIFQRKLRSQHSHGAGALKWLLALNEHLLVREAHSPEASAFLCKTYVPAPILLRITFTEMQS